MRITNGAVEYEKIEGPGKKSGALALDRINVTVTQGAVGEPLRVTGDARGPGDVKLTIAEGSVSLGPGRAVGDAQVKATVDVEGRDVRAVVGTLVPAPAVSGPIKGRVQVTGTGARLTATGAVTFDRLTLTDAPPHCPDPKPRTARPGRGEGAAALRAAAAREPAGADEGGEGDGHLPPAGRTRSDRAWPACGTSR